MLLFILSSGKMTTLCDYFNANRNSLFMKDVES